VLSFDTNGTVRRHLTSTVLSLSLVFVQGAITACGQVTLTRVGPIVLTVSNLDRAVEFYTDVLSFRKTGTGDAHLDSFDRLTGIFGTNIKVATLELGLAVM